MGVCDVLCEVEGLDRSLKYVYGEADWLDGVSELSELSEMYRLSTIDDEGSSLPLIDPPVGIDSESGSLSSTFLNHQAKYGAINDLISLP